jgi:uncharacterized SAM-binding protein YcdF (DUF218 family)
LTLKKLTKKKIFFILTFLGLAYCIAIAVSISLFAKMDETRKADVAIVLGASVWNDEPSPVFKERINHGIWLYKEGYINKIIFTGGKSKTNEYSDAYVAKNYAQIKGIDSLDILIEEKSTITEDNLKYAGDLMSNNDLFSALIVSDPLHMKRAMLMAKDKKIKAFSSPTRSSRYKSGAEKIQFLIRETIFLCWLSNIQRYQIKIRTTTV